MSIKSLINIFRSIFPEVLVDKYSTLKNGGIYITDTKNRHYIFTASNGHYDIHMEGNYK